MTNNKVPLAVFAGWLILLGCGWAAMIHYSGTPGRQALAPAMLPAALKQLSEDIAGERRPTLFVALHPQCSCSRATLHELRRVLHDAGAKAPRVYVLLYQPSQRPTDWSDEGVLSVSTLGDSTKVLPDPDGHFAAMLHASTSGEMVLYARDGRLLFQGGVTGSRGHEGASAGAERLQAALQNTTHSTARSSVFGCNIFHREQTAKGNS